MCLANQILGSSSVTSIHKKQVNVILTTEGVVKIIGICIEDEIPRAHSTNTIVELAKSASLIEVDALTRLVIFTRIVARQYVHGNK